MYNAAKKREYYLKNKSRILQYQREYREKHSTSLSNQAKEKYVKNKPRILKVVKMYRIRNPDVQLKSQLKLLYGLSLEEYKEMLISQEGKCFICKGNNKRKRLFVDHNHNTGKIRSLLCAACNAGIGYFKEDTSLLNKAISYLEMHNGN